MARTLNNALSWRIVVCEDGHTLPRQATPPSQTNRFAALTDTEDNQPQSAADPAPAQPLLAPALPPRPDSPVTLQGMPVQSAVVLLKTGRRKHLHHDEQTAQTYQHSVDPPALEHTTNPAQRAARADARRRHRREASLVRAANLAWVRGGVRMGHLNACGVSATTTMELQDIMRTINLDIVAVTETWEGKYKPCDIAGYTFIGKPRQDQQGGGVGFYVSRTLGPVTKAHFDTAVPESAWLEIDSRRRGERVRAGWLCVSTA